MLRVDTASGAGLLAGSVRLVDAFAVEANDDGIVETVRFSDGSEVAVRALIQGVVAGQVTPLDDLIEGSAGPDDVPASTGSDVIIGGDGDDIYRYARGDGDKRIIDTGDNPFGGTGDLLILTGDRRGRGELCRHPGGRAADHRRKRGGRRGRRHDPARTDV